MIARDQPTIFPPGVTVRVSDASDGTMARSGAAQNPDDIWRHRHAFIERAGGESEKTALVYVTYGDTRDYETYKLAETVGSGLLAQADDTADGLATQQKGRGLFLPVADCCPVVLYDPKNQALMLSHIGRHSVEVFGASKSLDFMKAQFGSDPRDVLVWLGPAVGGETYPIFARGNKSLAALIVRDLKDAGVPAAHIEVSPIDTSRDPRYFSHSEYQKARRESDGRFAVFAMMTPRGLSRETTRVGAKMLQ